MNKSIRMIWKQNKNKIKSDEIDNIQYARKITAKDWKKKLKEKGRNVTAKYEQRGIKEKATEWNETRMNGWKEEDISKK